MVARDGVERFSVLCNQQVADCTKDTKGTEASKDVYCVRSVCGFLSKIRLQVRRLLWLGLSSLLLSVTAYLTSSVTSSSTIPVFRNGGPAFAWHLM